MMDLSYWRNKFLATVIRTVAGYKNPQKQQQLYDEEIQIPSRDKNRTIKAHVYKPAAKAQGQAQESGSGSGSGSGPGPGPGPGPVVLNFHGSGFILHVHGEDAEYCHYLAQNSTYTVIDVSYRLAPEDPYPAALNDVEDTVKWVISTAEYDSNRIVLSGFSAGACLALAASAYTFEPGVIHSVVAFYPPTDLSRAPESKKPPATPGPGVPVIPGWVAGVFNACYIPLGVDPKTPGISPLFAAPERFPANVLIITCDIDTLCNEGEELAAKLKAADDGDGKRNLVLRRLENCPHAWDKRPSGDAQIQARDDAYKLTLDFLSK